MLRKHFLPLLNLCLTIMTLAALLNSIAWAAPRFKVLYNFKGGTDAAGPWAGVTFDRKGNLYGTTRGGGSGSCNGGCGTVFELMPDRNGKWVEKVVHSFNTPFGGPWGGLVADPVGSLYGTIDTDTGSYLFETTSGAWNQFALPDGGSQATLLWRDGNLYETGRAHCCGGIFQLTHDASGWKQDLIYAFQPHVGKNGTDGLSPKGTVVADGTGKLYGAAEFGGNYPPKCSGGEGCGVAFELTRKVDGTWEEHILHRFAQFKEDGQLPMAGLAVDTQGNLYGTTSEGGTHEKGTIYKLKQGTNGHWKETILFDFPHVEDGGGPTAGLVFDAKGSLYGTAGGGGGTCSCGVVFKLTPKSNGGWKYTVLHRFTGKDGGMVEAGLTPNGRGNFYGTTLWGGTYLYGVVFEITP